MGNSNENLVTHYLTLGRKGVKVACIASAKGKLERGGQKNSYVFFCPPPPSPFPIVLATQARVKVD